MTFVFIIDLDGTIIGDCVYQCEMYKIYLILRKLGINVKINEILEEAYKEKTRLIRPYFSFSPPLKALPLPSFHKASGVVTCRKKMEIRIVLPIHLSSNVKN